MDGAGAMDIQTKVEIEKTVLEILEDADMNDMTEYRVRNMAGKKLGLNLSEPVYKKFVRGIIENLLSSKNDDDEEEGEAQQATAEDEDEKPSTKQQKQGHAQAEKREEEEEEEEDEEEEEEERPAKKQRKEKPKRDAAVQEATRDDNGDIVICKLSGRRSVTIQNFRGQKLVSIREFFIKDGKELPSSKGISLTLEQWEAFKRGVPAIEEAIEQLK